MKIINYICDKCQRIVASHKITSGEVEPHHLLPMGHQDWCIQCVEGFNKGLLQPIRKSQIDPMKDEFTYEPEYI